MAILFAAERTTRHDLVIPVDFVGVRRASRQRIPGAALCSDCQRPHGTTARIGVSVKKSTASDDTFFPPRQISTVVGLL